MLEELQTAGERRGAEAVVRQIDQLAGTTTPPGVTVEAIDGGVRLTGKGLHRRLITDPNLRNFGR